MGKTIIKKILIFLLMNNLKRIERLQQLSKEKGFDLFIVVNPVNLFYLTGNFFKGLLLVSERKLLALVKRPLEVLKNLPFEGKILKSLKDLLPNMEGARSVGIDLKGLKYGEAERFLKVLGSFELRPADELIWELRMIKDGEEIKCLQRAGKILSLAIKKWIKKIKFGMTELEASGLLELELRKKGHPGFTRSSLGFELTYGYLISGKVGLNSTPFYTGEGGKGVEGFPGGASFKKINLKEPILLDFSGFYRGYYVDQTRMASFGPCKKGALFFAASLGIHRYLQKKVRPGMLAEEVWGLAVEKVEGYGLGEYFMKHGEEMKFVGHGVGLEIDEPPALAEGQKMILKEGMVLALEPKFHVPNIGVIGLEDTYFLTKKGLQRITPFPRKWIMLPI